MSLIAWLLFKWHLKGDWKRGEITTTHLHFPSAVLTGGVLMNNSYDPLIGASFVRGHRRKVALEFACLHGSITRVNTGTMAILGPRQTAPLRQSHTKAQGTATRLAQNSCTLCDTLIITWHSVLRCTFSSVLAFKCSRALFERKQRDKLVDSEPNQEKLGEKQTVTARLTAFNWLTLAVCPGNTILIGAR